MTSRLLLGGISLPKTELASVTDATQVQSAGAGVDIPGCNVTLTFEADTTVEVEFGSYLRHTAVNGTCGLNLLVDGVQPAGAQCGHVSATANAGTTSSKTMPVQVTAGQHTFKLQIAAITGGANAQSKGDGGSPAYMIVRQVG